MGLIVDELREKKMLYRLVVALDEEFNVFRVYIDTRENKCLQKLLA